jgi:uncharacterized protein
MMGNSYTNPKETELRNPTELDAVCRRILGCLLEKEQTTPDYYPLTLNALIAACNQTTNRSPVMALKRHEVLAAIHSMGREGLVQRVTGPRADRWSHMLIQPLYAHPPSRALLTVLLLRGSQTVGELKGRTERMHPFESLEEVELVLRSLAQTEPPLARELPRRPGQKESRWTLNVSGEEEVVGIGSSEDPDEVDEGRDSPSLRARVERLEAQVAGLLRHLELSEASQEERGVRSEE